MTTQNVPMVTFTCDACGRPVLTAKARIAPSIARDGWLRVAEACAPDATRPRATTPGADANSITTTATAWKSGGQDDFTP